MYTADAAANGGATLAGVGFLYDERGVDAYTARGCGATGEAWGACSQVLTVNAAAAALLYDGSGVGDRYVHEHPWRPDLAATDYTETPRGWLGAIIDREG